MSVKLQRVALSVILALLVIPLSAEAQPMGRVPRIGVLSVAPATAADDPGFNAFREALREFGYVDGKTVFLELRLAGGYERLPALAADLVRAPVDVIVTPGSSNFTLDWTAGSRPLAAAGQRGRSPHWQGIQHVAAVGSRHRS
jgi:hypothetical protein